MATQVTSAFNLYGAPGSDYAKLQSTWLGRYLLVEDKGMSVINGILMDAAQDAFTEIKSLEGRDNIGSIAKMSQRASVMTIVREINHASFRSIGSAIRDSQQDSAQAAVDAIAETELRFTKMVFDNVSDRESWYESQRHQAARGVANVISRYLGASVPLSRRVYRSESLANGYVERIVNSAIVNGSSAQEIAKRVREHNNPATPGGVSYAAKRLGRTELNNAFHATTIHLIQDRPWIDSAQWNLSKRHDEITGCKCEEYARQRLFPVTQIPRKPHPQCRCFTTPNLVDDETFQTNLAIGMYDGYVDA